MTRRDRIVLLGSAALVLGLMLLPVAGVHSDVLLTAPVLVAFLPLLFGRYVGEERLARLAAAFAPARRRPAAALVPRVRRVVRVLPRGGRLIASALAERPPPGAPLPS